MRRNLQLLRCYKKRRWGCKINQKMAAVHGKLCTIPPSNTKPVTCRKSGDENSFGYHVVRRRGDGRSRPILVTTRVGMKRSRGRKWVVGKSLHSRNSEKR
jgi:hypothetical protein